MFLSRWATYFRYLPFADEGKFVTGGYKIIGRIINGAGHYVGVPSRLRIIMGFGGFLFLIFAYICGASMASKYIKP